MSEYSARKNAFTADGGPHKAARILAVADGLRRIGEFESAEMLTAYAERIKADEGVVPVVQTAKWQQESLIDAAEEYAKKYDGDDRELIKTDVINAFYHGANWNRKAAQPRAVPKLDADDWAVLQRLRNALPDVGLNGWHRGVTVLSKLLAAAPSQGETE